MNMQQIRDIAQQHGIKPGKLAKDDLIHTIQLQEGNFDCFGSARAGECDQLGCLWRSDCLVKIARA